jgi:hypothetical protein
MTDRSTVEERLRADLGRRAEQQPELPGDPAGLARRLRRARYRRLLGWTGGALALLGLFAALVVGPRLGDSGRQVLAGQRPATVTIGRNDLGRTIGLEVGDHLELSLGPPSPSPSLRGIGPLRWTLASYPNDLLVLEDQDATHGRFRFTAKAAGQGRIVLGGLGDPCRPPRLCPMKPPGPVSPERPLLPDSFLLLVQIR